MKKIILSINPQYVEKIISGIKKFEYRTRVAKNDIKSIIVYCTFPTRKIVAEVKIKSILADSPENLWERTKEYSGINKDFFDKYFSGHKIAYAYELGEVIKYVKPKELADFGCKYAPQSFVYVTC